MKLKLFTSRKKDRERLVLFSKYKRFRYFFLIDNEWNEGIHENGKFYSLLNRSIITNLKDYIVSYRNGNIVYETQDFSQYPDGITFIPDGVENTAVFTKAELTEGNHLFKMKFSKSPIYPKDKDYYESTITNLSNQKVQVLKFGGFVEIDSNKYALKTITGDFFSSSDFNNWYMDSTDLWIENNETIFDPINYGGNNSFWAYQIKTDSGDILWFGNYAE